MRRNIEHLLDECLFQLNNTDADLDTILAQYPEQADILRPMLKAAMIVRDAPHPTPSPVAKTLGKQRLMMAVAKQRQEREHQRTQSSLKRVSDWIGRGLEFGFPMRRMAIGIATVVSMFVLSGLGVSGVAARSMPDSPLYPVKLVTEQVQIVLAPSAAERARLHIEFGQRRVEEAQELAQSGGDLDQVVLAMIQQNKQAFGAIAQVPMQERASLLADLADLTRIERHTLSGVKSQLSPDSQFLVSDAIAISAEDQARAEEASSNPILAQLIPTLVSQTVVRQIPQDVLPPLTPTVPEVISDRTDTDKTDRGVTQPPVNQPTKVPTLAPKPTKVPTLVPKPTKVPTLALPTSQPPASPTLVPTRPPDVEEPHRPKATTVPTQPVEATVVQQPTTEPSPKAIVKTPEVSEPVGTPVPLP